MIEKPVKIVSPAEKGFKKVLGRKLDTHNRAAIGSNFDWKNVEVEAKNARGKLVGGLYGGTYWGWLHVKMLWVDKVYRKQGVGTELIKKAGILAKKRGCKYVCLSTFSFHAPGFYRKLGFKRYASLKPFIKGSTRFYLYKKIS
jgi:ribosomal protein S18 acetylase RimI-like enzyme